MELQFPIEFLVAGTPVSFQSRHARSRDDWKRRVREASFNALPEDHWATGGRIAATLFFFPDRPMQGDVDNIVKLVLDALARHIYLDDRQVERVVVQKFEPERVFPFASPSARLKEALGGDRPILYVRISDDPFEELS